MALRAPGYTYVEFVNGQREYYDRTTDPNELHNIAASLPPARVAELHRALEAMHTCQGTAQCWTAGQLAP